MCLYVYMGTYTQTYIFNISLFFGSQEYMLQEELLIYPKPT